MLSIRNELCMTVGSVGLKGVLVSTIYDQINPDDPDPPGIHQHPYIQDLGAFDVFNNIFGRATGLLSPDLPDDAAGVISAVVLKSKEKMVLHANATDTVLRVVYKIQVILGETTNCKATVEDGLNSRESQPVPNVITVDGTSKKPTKTQGLFIRLKGKKGDKPANFVRGDANDDGKVDIGDAIWIVSDVVPSLAGLPTRCQDAGDANNDEKLDLVDAIYLINYL